MTPKLTLYLLENSRGPDLQRHIDPTRGGFCGLFGWDAQPAPVDAGPPAVVEGVFASALLRCGTIAFLCSSGESDRSLPHGSWLPVDGDHRRRLTPSLLDRLLRRPLPSVVATDDPVRAQALFTALSWSQQHQIGFVLAEGRLPEINRELVVTVLRARNACLDQLELPSDVLALAMPAVDGDYLELVTRERSIWDSVREAVAAECRNTGIPFEDRPAV